MMGTSIALLPRVPLPPRRALSAPYSEIGASHGERSYSSEQSHPAFSSFVGWCVGVTPDYHQPVCACRYVRRPAAWAVRLLLPRGRIPVPVPRCGQSESRIKCGFRVTRLKGRNRVQRVPLFPDVRGTTNATPSQQGFGTGDCPNPVSADFLFIFPPKRHPSSRRRGYGGFEFLRFF